MSTRKKPLSDDEICAAFPAGTRGFLSLKEFSALTGIPQSTLYEWKAKGRLDGAFRKRGKTNFIVRDRAIKLILTDQNGMKQAVERLTIGSRVTIYPRGKKGTYTAEYWDGKHRRKTLKTRNQKVARQLAIELEHELAHGNGAAPRVSKDKVAINKAIDDFVTYLQTERRRRKTITKYEGILRRKFAAFAVSHRVEHIGSVTLPLIDEYRAAEAQKLSPRSMMTEGVTLKTFLGWCVDRMWLDHNPLASQKFRRPKHEPVGGPTLAQINEILKLATPSRLAPFATLAFTGMRAGECQHLLPKDVDLDQGWIHIVSREGRETKTGESRKVPIHPRLAAILKQLPKRRGSWFFTAQRSANFPDGGHHLNMKHMNEDLQKVLKKLKLPVGKKSRGYTLHSLRSSFKTICIHGRIPREVVDKWQGHASRRPSASDAYYQLSDEESQSFMLQVPFGDAAPPGDGGTIGGSR